MRTLPSPSELNYFLEIAHTLNLSRAAERLGISQPALSLAVRRLEDAFGVPLLIRTKTGVKLTRTGQKFVAQARVLTQEWESIRTQALRDQSEIGGRFTIGCHPSVALYSLPEFLPRLLSEHPSLEFKLVHELSRKITEEVVSFRVDFGIVVNPSEHPDLVIQPVCRDEVTLWIAPGGSPLQDPSSGRAVLICDPELAQSQSLFKQMARKGLRFARTIPTSSLETITALTASGAGVGIIPSRVVRKIHPAGLRPLSPEAPRFVDRICLVYRADAQKTQASRLVSRAIEQGMKASLSGSTAQGE